MRLRGSLQLFSQRASMSALSPIYLKRLEEEKGWVIPIPVKPDLEHEEVVEETVNFVKRLHQVAWKPVRRM